MHALPMNAQLSNEIIARCCAVINLPTVFTGEVDEVMTVLRQSIEAGEWDDNAVISRIQEF